MRDSVARQHQSYQWNAALTLSELWATAAPQSKVVPVVCPRLSATVTTALDPHRSVAPDES